MNYKQALSKSNKAMRKVKRRLNLKEKYRRRLNMTLKSSTNIPTANVKLMIGL